MKNKNLVYLGSVMYLASALYIIFTNAGNNITNMLSGKFLMFTLLSVLVFIVLLVVIKEANKEN